MHHDGIGLCVAKFFFSQAEVLEIFLSRRNQGTGHALFLQTQHDDHIAILDAFNKVVVNTHPHVIQVAGQQSAWAHCTHLGATQGGQRMDVGTRHTAVQNIAHNGHTQLGEVLLVVANGIHVEQRLCWVGMPPIARVDHMNGATAGAVQMLGHEGGRTTFRMAHDKHVGRHGSQIVDGVDQRLALAGRRRPNVQIHHIGRQALGCNLECGASAGGVLEKYIEHRLAAQQRHLLHIAISH